MEEKTNPIKTLGSPQHIGMWSIEHQKIKPKAERPETSWVEQEQEASWVI